MSLLQRLLVIFCACGVVTAPVPGTVAENPAADAGSDNDPVRLVIDEYQRASDGLRSRNATAEERLQFYADWRDRIDEALRANPSSRFASVASVKLVGLENGVGDYAASAKRVTQLAVTANEPEEKFRWRSELGDITSARYEVTHDNAIAKAAVAAFTQADDDFKNIGKPTEWHRDRYIMNLCKAAVLYDRAIDDHANAAAMFQEAREQLAAIPPSAQLATLRYDFEYAASSEMTEWLAASKPQQAEQALELLAARTDMRWPPSYYAHMFASQRWPQGGKAFQAFARRWLSEKARDSWSVFFEFYLALDYFKQKEYAPAQPIFSELKEQHAEELLNADEKAIQAGRGGFYAETLYCLAVIFRELGDMNQASSLASEMKALAPNDPRAGYFAPPVAGSKKDGSQKVDEHGAKAEQLREGGTSWVIVVLLNVVVAVFLSIVFFWKKFKSQPR